MSASIVHLSRRRDAAAPRPPLTPDGERQRAWLNAVIVEGQRRRRRSQPPVTLRLVVRWIPRLEIGAAG
jgi:hypothetical protein